MDKAKEKARRKKYYWANRDKALKKATEWRRHNKERAKEISRNWRSANPEKSKIQSRKYCQRRYAVKKSSIHPELDQVIEMELFNECQVLSNEAGVVYHLDHIIPLAHGGFHHHLNLQPLPYSINQSKNDNPLWEMEGYKSWRDVPEFLWPEKLKELYKKLLTS